MKRALAIMLTAMAAPGCHPDNPYDDPLELSTPMATRSAVTWYDEMRDELIFATPGEHLLDVRRRPLGDETTHMQWCRPTVRGDALLLELIPASDKVEDVEETLVIVPGDGRGELRKLEVFAPFTSSELSPDGRLAVLYFGAEAPGGGLHNANQVAIVDLDAGTVRNLTLNGFGGRVQSVHFTSHTAEAGSGSISVGGRTRELIAFLAEDEVVLVDASDPTADQVSVNFRGAAGFIPTATMLRVGNEAFANPVLFLRGSGSTDVAMLTLVDKPDEATGEPGFSAQVSLVPVGAAAADFTTYDGDKAPYLVTVDAGTGSLVFTDIRTQDGFEVQLEGLADRVYLRDLQTDVGPVKQAVAWAVGGSAVHTLRLDEIEDAIGRAPERLDIETGIEQLVVLDNDRALVGSGENLYVLDFTLQQVTPLQSSLPYDPSSSALDGNRLLLGTPGQSWISSVDLTTLNPESMVLDDPISNFFYVEDADKVVVVHPDPSGFMTVADAADPSRATSYSTWGILLEDVLERPILEDE